MLGAFGLLVLLVLPGRLPAQSNGPVDVLTRDQLRRTGRTRLSEILHSLVPAFNLTRPAVAGGAEHVRQLTLHGFGADHVLVLVNGKRRHPSALLDVSGGIGRGQGTVDLDAIPVSAVERIEVHRDGAAAGFGFGAVAGVINIVLAARAPNEASAELGTTTAGDGMLLRAGGSYGFALGKNGFLTLAGEASSRGASNRALPDRRAQYFPNDPRNNDPGLNHRVNHRFGDPVTRDITAFLNAEQRLTASLDAYGFAGLSRRSGESGELWRRPSDDRTVRAIYPNGFLPLLTPTLRDGSVVAGLRGRVLGFRWEGSLGYGRSSFRYDLAHTANASLGPQSPTQLYSGTLRADQFSAELSASRRIVPGWLPPLQLSLTAAHRSEGYEIQPGEPDSYRYGAVLIPDGPNAGGIAAIGAQGFPGFRPSDAGLTRRSMLAAQGELATVIRERLALSAAGRVEDSRDFPALGTYQFSARFGPLYGFSMRGAYGTGVRIPALAQVWFSSSATDIVGPLSFEDRTVPVRDPLAVALGATPLRPERSRNLSLGLAVAAGSAFSLSADLYRVSINHRIILSGTFDDRAVREFLAEQGFFGIGGVRFFSNALATRTSGLDAAAAYQLRLGDASLRLSAALNHNTTQVTRVDTLPGLLGQFTEVLFSRVERARIERGQPRDNVILSGQLSRGSWGVHTRTQRFGTVSSFGRPANGALDQTYGAKWLSDLSVSYRFRRLTVMLGADNLFNTYPERNRFGDATSEGNSNFGMFPYPENSPIGFTGRFVYVRAGWR